MILRIYRARIVAGREQEFEALARVHGVASLRKARGCTAFHFGWSVPAGEFVTTSYWASLEDVKAFAGADWQKPVIPPEEAHLVASAGCEHFALWELPKGS